MADGVFTTLVIRYIHVLHQSIFTTLDGVFTTLVTRYIQALNQSTLVFQVEESTSYTTLKP